MDTNTFLLQFGCKFFLSIPNLGSFTGWNGGHVHLRYGTDATREREYHGTQVINVCEKYVLDIPDGEIGTWKKPNMLERVRYFFQT